MKNMVYNLMLLIVLITSSCSTSAQEELNILEEQVLTRRDEARNQSEANNQIWVNLNSYVKGSDILKKETGLFKKQGTDLNQADTVTVGWMH